MIGSTCESVARYVRTGEFGLWNETGLINDAAAAGTADGIGFGEAVGRMIEEERFPYRRTSVLATGYRWASRDRPRGVRSGHRSRTPQFRRRGRRRGTYADFLVFTDERDAVGGRRVSQHRHRGDGARGVSQGPDHGPKCRRARSRVIQHFTTAVFDLASLGDGSRARQRRPTPSIISAVQNDLVRTVADGGKSYYVEGDHRATVPALYDQILARAQQ